MSLIAALIALPACSGVRPANYREVFDERTGNTLSVVSKPLVFARDRADVAAFARDYATLVAVEIDQSGTNVEYLLLYRWSTVDRRMSEPPGAELGELRVLAEDRVLDLKPLDAVPVSLTRRRDLHLPVHGDIVTHAYRVDADVLKFIATSRELEVQLPQEPLDTPFRLWEDGRAALHEFLDHTVSP